MKARLLTFEGVFHLLLCTGKIKMLSAAEAYEFVSQYDNPSYYAGSGRWDYEDISMESYHGDTIAWVGDDGVMHIEDAEQFRAVLDSRQTIYLTAVEYADKHEKYPTLVRRLCQNGRIPGAILKGKTWLIPASAPYPADERVRN